jgi:hypothetical protein
MGMGPARPVCRWGTRYRRDAFCRGVTGDLLPGLPTRIPASDGPITAPAHGFPREPLSDVQLGVAVAGCHVG